MTFLYGKKLILLAVLLLSCGGWTVPLLQKPGSSGMEQGYLLQQQGDSAGAAQNFHQAYQEALDDKTKRQALEELGKLYSSGAAPGNAVTVLEEAVRLGSIRAHSLLGEMYENGKSVMQDRAKAIAHYRVAAKIDAKASLALAELLESQAYFDQAVQQMRQEDMPPVSIMLQLARYYRDGSPFTPYDRNEAEYWYRKAIENGNDTAAMELAEIWFDEQERPFADVASLWKQAADFGNIRAMMRLGIAYDLGWGGLYHPEQAEVLLANAVTADPGMAYPIGRWYERVVENDAAYLPKMLYWYQVAAEYGQPDALLKLARRYWKGEGVAPDRDKARQLFAEAALAGNDQAQPELMKYEQREEAKRLREEERAARKQQRHTQRKQPENYASWIEQAKRGDTVAMRETGEALMSGKGVKRDAQQAVMWLQKAADKGDVSAMMGLAKATIAGEGVTMNVTEAYQLYRRAAQAGNSEAQYHLGIGYARGIGVPQDDKLARKWLSLAAKNGYILADEIYKGFRNAKE